MRFSSWNVPDTKNIELKKLMNLSEEQFVKFPIVSFIVVNSCTSSMLEEGSHKKNAIKI